jgi:hypothetical protein
MGNTLASFFLQSPAPVVAIRGKNPAGAAASTGSRERYDTGKKKVPDLRRERNQMNPFSRIQASL